MDDRDENDDNVDSECKGDRDRLVAELAGIETALVSLQDQVGQTFFIFAIVKDRTIKN